MEPIKINSLEFENVKRVKAVHLEPKENGLTIIGGDNRQGKTTVLDAIAWVLGGNKFAPDSPKREGSLVEPTLHITLSNGLIVERKGKNSALKVTDPEGNKGTQALLNTFIEEFALNIPKFMNANDREKATSLLQIIGVGATLEAYDNDEQKLYNRRTEIGRIADQKKKYADELPSYPDAPNEPVSAMELIQQQQAILAKNGENQRKRAIVNELEAIHARQVEEISQLQERLNALTATHIKTNDELGIAKKTAEELQDESTSAIENSLDEIELINAKVRTNYNKKQAEIDAAKFSAEYDDLTAEIDDIRTKRKELLDNANLPLEGLSVKNGELTYNGFKWCDMSGADQLIVATAIVRKLNPECGFVLIDKLEQMDMTTINTFGQWLEKEGLQVIATRVSQGDECSVIIEDGYVKESETTTVQVEPKWKGGTF